MYYYEFISLCIYTVDETINEKNIKTFFKIEYKFTPHHNP